MTEPTLLDYIAQLQHHADADVRRNAAWILGRARDIRIIPPLIAALQDADTAVRIRAAEALGNGRYDNADITEALSAAINTEAEPAVRAQLLIALGRQGDLAVLPTQITALQDADASVRSAAAEGLRLLADARAVPALIDVLRQDTDPNVRYDAARALVQIGDPAAPALIEALQTAQDPAQQCQMIEVLGQLSPHPDTISALQHHLTATASDDVRTTVQWALKQLGVG